MGNSRSSRVDLAARGKWRRVRGAARQQAEGGGEMSGVAEVFFRGARIEVEADARVVEPTNQVLPSHVPSLYDDQVRLLVERLFLHPEHAPRRHVCFAAADPRADV